MKKINVNADYNVFDLSITSEIDKIINKLGAIDENEIELNLSNCFLSYPKAQMLTDHILKKIAARNGIKKLLIVYDLSYPKEGYLKWFFHGSDFFDIASNKELSPTEIEKLVIEKLSKYQIQITIQIVDDGNEIDRYELREKSK